VIALPYLLGAAVAVGAAGGGFAAWKWQESTIDGLELSNVRFQAAASVAEQIAKREAAVAEAQIAQIILANSQQDKEREVIYVDRVKEIKRVASPTARCLSPSVVRRLLDNSPSRSTAAEGQDPRIAALGISRPAADTDGPGTSELGISVWIAAAQRQYEGLKQKHAALSNIIRTLPCVTVE